jgi:uncharacterized protein YceH (UPF0502 family)
MHGETTMNYLLDENEARVLGSLVEKEITTPDYYPLSLNALVHACNQRSNRDPVMDLDEEAVRKALDGLQRQGLAGAASTADSRVPKYEHRLQGAFNFDRRETAVLTVLLLRGPQTPGELRARAERMHPFHDLDELLGALHRLMERQPPLVKMLARQPGTKEARYAHLLSGDVESWELPRDSQASAPETPGGDRMARLEAEVASLRAEVAELKHQLEDFRKQFE